MLETLSGITNLKNFNNTDYVKNFKLEEYLAQDEALQDTEKVSLSNDGASKIDFSKINNNDVELKADLQGLIEKNQTFDDNGQFGGSEITTGEVANKFSDVFGNYINSINDKNKAAEKAVETFASGGNIDMHSVMIASEKASLSMQLAIQMKNKILQAYQEISRIQV